MFNQIKALLLKYLSFLDINKDGKLDITDADVAKTKVDATITEITARIDAVKTEATDVVVAVKEVVKQSKDIVTAAKGKKRSGPKNK
jgi:hypothetical protein